MSNIELIVSIFHIICAVFLIVVVLLQSSKSSKLSGSIAGGAETFFGKNKGRSIDGVLHKMTGVMAFLFVVCTVLLGIFSRSR